MTQFQNWFAMGGYASYIWTAYGCVGVVLLLNLVNIKWQRIRTKKKLQNWFRRQP